MPAENILQIRSLFVDCHMQIEDQPKGCRPKPRYSAGSPTIRNFAARVPSHASCQAEDFAYEILEIADDSIGGHVDSRPMAQVPGALARSTDGASGR